MMTKNYKIKVINREILNLDNKMTGKFNNIFQIYF